MNTLLLLTALALGQTFTNTSPVDVQIILSGDIIRQGTGSFDMQVDLSNQKLLRWGASLSFDQPDFSLQFTWTPWMVPADFGSTNSYLVTATLRSQGGNGTYEFGESSGAVTNMTVFWNWVMGEFPGDGHPPKLYIDELPDNLTMTYFREELIPESWVISGSVGQCCGVRAYFPHNNTQSDRQMVFDFDPVLAELNGDFDNDGTVGPGDLNLVLFNWDLNDVTSDWINQRPVGSVGAGELNSVLFNWSSTASAVSTVPEPAGWILMVVALLVVSTVTASRRP